MDVSSHLTIVYFCRYDAHYCQYQLALSRLSDRTLVGVCQTVGGAHADCYVDRSCTEMLTKVLYDGSDEYEFELSSDEIDDCERYCWAPGRVVEIGFLRKLIGVSSIITSRFEAGKELQNCATATGKFSPSTSRHH